MAQIGDAKTLNSNNQAKVGEKYTIPAGETRTFTIAGNRDTANNNNDGQLASFSLIAVNTSATVSGALPITGALHVINESLDIGSAEVAVGSSDQDSKQTEEVGTINELFAAIRITNNSSEEDVRVRSIRWQQTGSASPNDIANIVTIVDGVSYPTTVSGDWYTAQLGSGILIAEGFNKEFTLRGDIVSGSGRTVQFDIDENTDIYVTGETFGFGIGPTQIDDDTAGDGAEMTSGTPFFDGSLFDISAGSITSFSKSNAVPAQNVAINVPSQPLGAFEADIKGEALTIQKMVFHFQMVGGIAGTDLTNITLVDANGSVVAGPSDSVAVVNNVGKVTFSDTVTLAVGKSILTLKGKLSTAFANDDTIVASTTPSSDWTGVKGDTTGDTITLTVGVTTGNTMTVKAASVSAKISTTPAAQNIVGGVTGMIISNLQLDGTQSGEDVRFTSIQLRYTSNSSGNPTNCRLWDGNTQLTDSGVDPTTNGTAYSFSLDESIIVVKGTIKTLAVKCDVTGSVAVASTFSWGIDATDSISGTGIGSSSIVDATNATLAGPTMTVVGEGSLTVELDSSSPSYALVSAGTSDVILSTLKLTAINEIIFLNRIALQLSNDAASSSPGDLLIVGIYNGSDQVGTAVFSGTSRYATTTLTTEVEVPKDGTVILTIKGTLSTVGTSQPGTQGALVQVDFDGDDPTGTRGRGFDSGSTIDHSSATDTTTAGVRLFRTVPTFTQTTFTESNQTAESNADLLRFMVTADAAGDLLINKFTLQFATTTATISNFNIHVYQNGYDSGVVSGLGTDGEIVITDIDPDLPATDYDFVVDQNSVGYITVPAGATRYFIVKGDVDSITNTTGSVKVTLLGDASYPSLSTLMGTAASIEADTNDDFIWSPEATTTITTSNVDWTNGYRVSGLSADGFSQTVSNQ
ncbi:hypothetical protein IID26_02145 [Patescibacteria group bacterium]|nr:hypothetical protein [Patescibacteria group bacterium]